MSSIPPYDGPSQALSSFQGQVFLSALALDAVPAVLGTIADLQPYLVDLPPGLIDWIGQGGSGQLGSLSTLYGTVAFDLTTLPAADQIAAIAFTGGASGQYVIQVIPLAMPVDVTPGPMQCVVQFSLQAFDDLAGE